MSKGLKSVKTLTAKQIADKWKLPLSVVANKIAAGIKVEKEHTKSTSQANEIARDHLGERPDYYEKLHKMEKTKVVKEESATGAVRGLGFVTGDPGVNFVDQYINTNAMAYQDDNGNKLEYLKKQHTDLHNSNLGFKAFDPTKIGAQTNFNSLKEAKLNELGEYDNKGGTVGAEGLTDASPLAQKRKEVKEQGYGIRSYTEKPMVEKRPVPDAMPTGADRGIYEISAELVGKVSNARWRRGEAPSKTLSRAINKKFIESGKKKEEKNPVKEDANRPDRDLEAKTYTGATGITRTTHEETKMDNKERINEALDCILENNLSEMKENLLAALQEKAMDKLEERKKEIAANYFAE